MAYRIDLTDYSLGIYKSPEDVLEVLRVEVETENVD